MRNLRELDKYRVTDPKALALYGGWAGDETCGAFLVPSPFDHVPMVVVASSEGDWDHLSVSRRNRTPNWREMEHVAKLFFKDDETAVQFHVPPSDHINIHPYCLHWWRSQNVPFPRPPAIFV